MSEEPGPASLGDEPRAPGQGSAASSASAPQDSSSDGDSGPDMAGYSTVRRVSADGPRPGPEIAAGKQPGISDLGKFDWFAEPPGPRGRDAAGRLLRRLTLRARRGSQGRGGQRSSGRRLAAAATGLALACTLLGGVVGGVIALHSVGAETDPTYSLGPVPPALVNRPATSVAGIAARDTPGVVMIKVNGGEGTGSGFIVSGGYIVTDNHVVTLDGLVSDSTLRVYFSNGKSVPGVLVGRDPYSDIAVLKVAGATRLPALSLGNSASVDVGDPVIAIGSPLGLADTVTSGIVSALNRPVQPGPASGSSPQVFFDAIQTDAPINPGNSGGPLVNAEGQVIGIDAAIDTLGDDPITGSQGGSIGLGFAIPIDQARRVVVQLIRTGHATHSVFGASFSQNFAGTGAQIPASSLAKTPEITPGGPAARAGIRPGDVIVKFAGLPISNAYSLMDAVRSQAPGSRVSVTFLRQGRTLSTTLTLGSAGS
jgi:putative serine protease PepD